MPCPFPGMDPYIERPAIWPDFHDSLITCIRGLLQPLLKPRYVALTQERLYVVESERSIRPDVAVLKPAIPQSPSPRTTSIAEADQPAVFELVREELRQPFLTIIEPVAGERVVTAIEVLSPDNKRKGPGRKSYLRKRDEYWSSETNLVEIDLLRAGRPTVRVSEKKLQGLRPFDYLVATTRFAPAHQEVYSVSLRNRLPRVAIPLLEGDRDVVLDLQAAFTRCWNEGPYPALLRYEQSPPGRMNEEDVRWCEQVLAEARTRLNDA